LGAFEPNGETESDALGMLNLLPEAYAGKRVFVTGHTGFKGSWLTLWLRRLGALVKGFSLEPPTQPSMFQLCNVADGIDHVIGDIRDHQLLARHLAEFAPDVVFHMAAQPIVRLSFAQPLDTLSSNIMGTAHVLEAVRMAGNACAVVVISSDKCYDNREWVWGYRENDPMGGKDPYSMSKGATELVVSSWRESFFPPTGPVKLASARAGNVIGGGDWAADRIVPDCIRAFSCGEEVELRNPFATRPWQHVLEPLGGYLLLGSRLLGSEADKYCSGWNFGPATHDVGTVEQIVGKVAQQWGDGCRWSLSDGPHVKEASMLALNCDKAITQMGWSPTWSLQQLADLTVDWYKNWHVGSNSMRELTMAQIDQFTRDAASR
jgi:CDP-glucose 4,6-dehydratase